MRRAAPPVPQRHLVAFRLGDSEFALDVFAAHEVLRLQPITAVPRAPAFVEGVIDVRGTLLPVVDMRRRFEVADPRFDAETRILLIALDGERVGLVVDRVTEVLRVPETDVAPPPSYVQHRAANCLSAIVRLPQRLLLVLDVERLLSGDERVALSDLEAAIEAMREADAAEAAAGDGTEAGAGAPEAGERGA